MLLAHAFAIQQIEMGEWHHGDLVEVLDEGNPIRELTDADLVADASDGWAQLVLLDFAVEELLNVVNVEAR